MRNETEMIAAAAASVAAVCSAQQKQLEHSVAALLSGGGLGARLPLPAGVVRSDDFEEAHWKTTFKMAHISHETLRKTMPSLEIAVELTMKAMNDWVERIEFAGVEPVIPTAAEVREQLKKGVQDGKRSFF